MADGTMNGLMPAYRRKVRVHKVAAAPVKQQHACFRGLQGSMRLDASLWPFCKLQRLHSAAQHGRALMKHVGANGALRACHAMHAAARAPLHDPRCMRSASSNCSRHKHCQVHR